jgi:hypothetical protein
MNNSTNANGANFDPYLTWLGIRDPQRPPNHYRLLGLEIFESDPEVIAAAADRQMTYVRTYQSGQHSEHSQRILTELTTAKLSLLKPERKREYDDRLRAAHKPMAAQQTAPGMLPHARPLAGNPALHPQTPGAVPRPVLARPIPQAMPAAPFGNDASEPIRVPFVRGTVARPASNSSVMQWSIVGGLVVATVILAVILANKFSGDPAAQPVAQHSAPAKVTPTAAGNPKSSNPSTETLPATEPATSNTEPATTNSEPTTTNTEPSVAVAATPAKNPDEQRPGPVKATLPNIPLPGIEEPSTPQANPQPPAPMNPTVPVAAMPTTANAATANEDPLNSLPTSAGNNPTEPAPSGNPATPSTDPLNPLAMPNPAEANPLNGEMPKPAATRRPVPSAKEITDNRALVRETFKAAYAAKSNTLGKDLLKTAREANEKPALMYTAYDEARLVGIAVNDLDTAFAVHDELTREFAVDSDKDLLETLKTLTKYAATMSPENAGHVLDVIQESVTATIQDHRLDAAEQLLKYVTSFSGRVIDKTPRDVAFRELLKKLNEHKAFAAKAKEFKEALAKNPNDANANLELGKFWAFQQGNFDQGLSYLAKGSDSEIREAANRELTLKPDSPEFVKVADAWWEVANKLPPDPRAMVKTHAAYAYARSLTHLKALDRGQAEARINEAYKSFKPNNREVKELIKVLLTRTNWKMEWKGDAPRDAVVGFEVSGSCTADDYPGWKLMDNNIVVCLRERDWGRFGGPPGGGPGGGPGKGRSRGRGMNNDNNNNNSKSQDPARNSLQIAVTANRIDIRVLNDGEVRGSGTGTPE